MLLGARFVDSEQLANLAPRDRRVQRAVIFLQTRDFACRPEPFDPLSLPMSRQVELEPPGLIRAARRRRAAEDWSDGARTLTRGDLTTTASLTAMRG
jgi:hypothetical protein